MKFNVGEYYLTISPDNSTWNNYSLHQLIEIIESDENNVYAYKFLNSDFYKGGIYYSYLNLGTEVLKVNKINLFLLISNGDIR